MPSFTPTEQKLMDLLGDGKPHTIPELFRCLPDDLGDTINLRVHISNIRKKLRPGGHDIVGRDSVYYLVRLMASPYRP